MLMKDTKLLIVGTVLIGALALVAGSTIIPTTFAISDLNERSGWFYIGIDGDPGRVYIISNIV